MRSERLPIQANHAKPSERPASLEKIGSSCTTRLPAGLMDNLSKVGIAMLHVLCVRREMARDKNQRRPADVEFDYQPTLYSVRTETKNV